MDIHKPKPVRNWREFLKEYAIIVIGVLTALAAEQGVEWLHWRGEVARARVALRAEIADNNSRFFARRVATAPCMERQIAEAGAAISALQAGRPPVGFTTFHLGSGGLLNDSEWQSDRASQVLTHFPRAELAVMGRYYTNLAIFTSWMVAEGDAWRALSGLKQPPAALTSSDVMHLLANLETTRSMLDLITNGARGQLGRAKAIGLPDAIPNPDLVKAFCTMDEPQYRLFQRSGLR